jgi:hypothetical protein
MSVLCVTFKTLFITLAGSLHFSPLPQNSMSFSFWMGFLLPTENKIPEKPDK